LGENGVRKAPLHQGRVWPVRVGKKRGEENMQNKSGDRGVS